MACFCHSYPFLLIALLINMLSCAPFKKLQNCGLNTECVFSIVKKIVNVLVAIKCVPKGCLEATSKNERKYLVGDLFCLAQRKVTTYNYSYEVERCSLVQSWYWKCLGYSKK